jgi:gliding motility-associated-like protein
MRNHYCLAFITSFFLLTCSTLFSQPKECLFTDWSKHYGGTKADHANDIRQTKDGGYVVAGATASEGIDVVQNYGAFDYWILKVDKTGNIEWSKNYGGTLDDIATSVVQTPDGGYLVVGGAVSFNGFVLGSHGKEDVWVLKLSPTGDLVWAKTFGGTQNERAEVIQPTADGNYIIGGYSESSNGNLSGNKGLFDYWLFKITPDGNILWQKNFGGSQADWCFDIRPAPDGGFLAAGSTFSDNGDVTSNQGFYDYWLIKLDANGNLLWERSFGGFGEERAYALDLTTDGGMVMAGTSISSGGIVGGNNGSFDVWAIKLNGNGSVVWSKNFGGSTEDRAFDVKQTADKGFVVAGMTASANIDVSNNYGLQDAWLLKLDDAGNLLWEKTFGGSANDRFSAILQTADEGFIAAGFSLSPDVDLPANYGMQDLWVIKLTLDSLDFDLGKDTALCGGETLLLNAVQEDVAYRWQDGSTDSMFLVENPGKYWLEVDKSGCKASDTILVAYITATAVDLGADSIVCEGETLLLQPAIPGANYLWNDGSTMPDYLVQTSGKYWVTVLKDGCEYFDTITVGFAKIDLELGKDTFLCGGQTLFLDVALPNASYRWQDQSEKPDYFIDAPGDYWVKVWQGGCQKSDTIRVKYQLAPDSILPAYSLICEEEPLVLDATQPGDAAYLWQDGSVFPAIKAKSPGKYSVEVTLNGCTFKDDIELTPCELCLYVPNAFSPNGDGLNDEFMGFPGSCDIVRYRMTIFDRWGSMLFYTEQKGEGWNGDFQGRKLPAGSYVYLIEFNYLNNSMTYRQERKGTVTLLR